ncbi:MAG: DUF4405 domain-containing protein [Pseudomonadota bacterium]
MIKKSLVLRLLLDGLAAGLLFVALAYYWLDNAAHEWVGTIIFALLIVHNVFNRRWYGARTKTTREPRSLIDSMLTLSLLVIMLALLVTSLMISRTVFSFLQTGGGFTARQIHMLAAYWVLVFVGIHLGLRWDRVMNALRNAFNITGKSTLRTAALRMVAAAIAAWGIQSSFAMGLGAKLTLQMSPDGWDFEESAPGFFLNWFSIVGLHAVLSHHAFGWIKARARNTIVVSHTAKR